MNKNIDRHTPQFSNVWYDVKSDIEFKILAGDFVAGERLPSVRKIAEDYSIGLSTAQKIFNSLWHDGIVELKRGVGYFVKPYIRERLISSRKQILERKLLNVIEEAALIGVDIVSMIEKCNEIKKRQN